MHKYPIQKELLTTSPRTRCPEGIGRPTPSGLGSAQVNTVRRKTYKQYQPEDITAALYLVATSQASIIQAAKQFNIPTRTLYQRIYNIKKLYALGREPDPPRTRSLRDLAPVVATRCPNPSGSGCDGTGSGIERPDPEPNPEGVGRPLPEGQRVEICSTPEHIVIKLEPYLLSEVLDPPRVDSPQVSSVDEFKVNELPTSGRDAEGVQLCDSEGLKNLMLTSLHASSLRVPSTLMSQ